MKQRAADEVNILEHLNTLKRHKWFIIALVVISVSATALVAYRMPPVYAASAIITPAAQQTSQQGMSSIVAQFGIVAQQPMNISEILNLLGSNILREKMIKRHKLLPVLLEDEPNPDYNDPAMIGEGLRTIDGALKLDFRPKENVIEISSEFNDPKMAADLIRFTLDELTDHMTGETRRVAETNRKYLEGVLNNTYDPLIKNKLYNLIAQQIETSMMAEVKENFAFKVLDPPRVPDKRSKPNKRKMITMSFVASLFAGVLLSITKGYFDKMKAANE